MVILSRIVGLTNIGLLISGLYFIVFGNNRFGFDDLIFIIILPLNAFLILREKEVLVLKDSWLDLFLKRKKAEEQQKLDKIMKENEGRKQ